MAKRKFTEVEIIAALKRAESGLTYEQVGREIGVPHAVLGVHILPLFVPPVLLNGNRSTNVLAQLLGYD